MFSNFAKRLWPSRSINCRSKCCPRPTRLNLELLERRDLLSGFATPFYEVYQPPNGAAPMSSSGPSGYTPSQISQAYGFNQISFQSNGSPVAANGAGQTIAIVDAYNDPNISSDLQTFDRQFGLPNPNFSVLNQTGGTALPANDTTGWAVEESLDVEWAHAIAPAANIVLVEANSNSFSDLFTAVQTAAALPGVAAVSMSWGGSEFSGETNLDSIFTTPAGHSGVVFIAASGDNGAGVSYPAASPNVLSVGGTTLNLDSAGNYVSESAWSGSGGGISSYETRPSWQPSTYSNGTSTGTSTMRMSPDVAFDADPNTGVAVCDSYNFGTTAPWLKVGGTSVGAPSWAGLIALADQGRQLAGESSEEETWVPAILHEQPSDYHDITSGGNGTYSAGPGYDLVTGLGTPIANYLVAPPVAPTLTATPVSTSQINLSWNSPAGAGLYTLERSLDDTHWQVVAYVGGAGSTNSGLQYPDSGLQPGTTYYYRVLATNLLGISSPYSAPARAVTALATPTGLTATTGATASSESNGQIKLSWNSVANATSYTLVRSDGASWTVTGTSYTDSTLQSDTTYSYAVRANDSATSSPFSAPASTVSSMTANEHFVLAVYQDILGRSGSKAELDGWANQMPSIGQSGVANAIVHSTEHYTDLVDGMYVNYLGRPADSGSSYWVGLLESGQTLEQVLSQFLASGEFFNDCGGNNYAFVNQLYLDFLKRPADAGGLSYWAGQLNSGAMSRQTVAYDLLFQMPYSTEFRTDAVNALYGTQDGKSYWFIPDMLGRAADSGGLSHWVNSGVDLLNMEVDFAATSEFYQDAQNN